MTELTHYGVKGMRWGVRRRLRREANTRKLDVGSRKIVQNYLNRHNHGLLSSARRQARRDFLFNGELLARYAQHNPGKLKGSDRFLATMYARRAGQRRHLGISARANSAITNDDIQQEIAQLKRASRGRPIRPADLDAIVRGHLAAANSRWKTKVVK